MSESVVEGLRAEVKKARTEQAAKAAADRKKVQEKSDQIRAGLLRKERNIVLGGAPDTAPAPAPATPPPAAPKEGK